MKLIDKLFKIDKLKTTIDTQKRERGNGLCVKSYQRNAGFKNAILEV